jgi:hypothetical protein
MTLVLEKMFQVFQRSSLCQIRNPLRRPIPMRPPRPRRRALPVPPPNRIRAISRRQSRLSNRSKLLFVAPIRKARRSPGLFPKGLGAKQFRDRATSTIGLQRRSDIVSMCRIWSEDRRNGIDVGKVLKGRRWGFVSTAAVAIRPLAGSRDRRRIGQLRE